jgi:threonine/homoserine/homoserine lactone efflux protein
VLTDLIVAAALGFGAGFLGSMPLAGPVAVLILDRAFRGDRRKSLSITAGASVAETAHALIVGLTLPLLLTRWPGILAIARGVGAALLLLIGALLFAKPSVVSHSDVKRRGGNFITGLAAAGLNPTLLASWTAVISAMYGEGWLKMNSLTAAPFALGVGIGVSSWLTIVVLFAHRFRERMDVRRRGRLVRGFGVLLIGIGAYLAVRLATDPEGPEAARGPGKAVAARAAGTK